jgi:hypothetical protein
MNPRSTWLCPALTALMAAALGLLPYLAEAQTLELQERIAEKAPAKTNGPAPVPWPYQSKRREATPEQITQWIKDLGDDMFKVREIASKALVEVGAPALKGLQGATNSGDVEVRQRARLLIDRIETYEALAPSVINVKLDDVPLPKAVDMVAKQSKFKLELIPQQGPGREKLEQIKIKLELKDTPFWESLDKLCAAGGLMYFQNNPAVIQLQVMEGQQAARVPAAYTGPFRMRITNLNYYRGLNLMTQPANPQAVRSESLTANMDMITESHVALMNIGPVQITEAIDGEGQSLATANLSGGNSYPVYYDGRQPPFMQPRQMTFNLRPAAKASANLQVLKGTVPVEVRSQRKPLITVDDIFSVKTKLYKGNGVELAILQVYDQGNKQNGNIRFFMTGSDLNADQNRGIDNIFRTRFELTDADGRPYYNLNVNANVTAKDTVEGSIYFGQTGDAGQAFRLTFNSHKVIRTSVPFEFKNVPMP